MIKGVTFDLWDTMIRDDSDEPERRRRSLRSKRDERRYLVWQALNAQDPISLEDVTRAYDIADAAFRKVWHDQFVTWSIGERLEVLLEGIGRRLPDAVLAELVTAHEAMEVEIPPQPVEGTRQALADLAGHYKLCVVSDTIVTPGERLRELLEIHGLKDYFSGFAFSDEVGRSKPHPAMFQSAAEQLGLALDELVHIGDRDHNDVKGAQALSMKAILFTAIRDQDRNRTSADAICARHADLPAVVNGLAAA